MAASLAGIGAAVGVAVLMVVNRGDWTVVPAHTMGLVAAFPLMVIDLNLLMHRSTRSAILTRGRIVMAVSAVVLVYVLSILASEGFVLVTSVMDDCQEELGQGRYRGRDATVVFCQASMHEAEEWLQIHPVAWRRSKHGVGYSGQESWAQRLDHVGARDIYPRPGNESVFASKPIRAEVDDTTLRVYFEDGTVKEVDPSQVDQPICADHIYTGGEIHTMDEPAVVQAVAIANGRFLAVGTDEQIMTHACPATQVHDLKGRTVIPGLTDAHAHITSLGLMDRWLDLRGAQSPEQVAEQVKQAAEKGQGWILGRGWDQTIWPDGYPDRKLLDEVAGDRPVYLSRVDGHAAWVNTRALQEASIDADTPDPEVGIILRRKDGTLSGILVDSAAEMVEDLIPPPTLAEKKDAIRSAIGKCLSAGLTMVHDAGVDGEIMEIYRELITRGQFPFRVYAMVCFECDGRQDLMDAGPVIAHEERLWLRAVKLYADGALGSRGAALLAPYSDDPENSGVLTDPDMLERLVKEAVDHGFQPATHAIGDRANHVMLDIYQRVLQAHPDEDLRPRLEHAQIMTPEDIRRMGKLGVIASMQPTHCTTDMRWAEKRLGPERLDGAYAWRQVLQAGGVLASGSDFPVESHDPFLGIQAAVTRADLDGWPEGGWRPQEKLTVQEALMSFTAWPARASFNEDLLGTIAPGKLADMVVLDRDIFTIDASKIHTVRPVMTVVGGEVAYPPSP